MKLLFSSSFAVLAVLSARALSQSPAPLPELAKILDRRSKLAEMFHTLQSQPAGARRDVLINSIKATVILMNRRMDNYTKYLTTLAPDDAAKVRQAVTAGRWFIGMDSSAFIISKGEPKDINSTTTAQGSREQYVYGLGKYYYFDESDKLTTAQD